MITVPRKKKNKPKRGGARPGAGRKTFGENAMVNYTIRIDPIKLKDAQDNHPKFTEMVRLFIYSLSEKD
jgi:hypothetical protein